MLLDGRPLGLEYVQTDLWGGFSLNLFLATAAIIFHFHQHTLGTGQTSELPFPGAPYALSLSNFPGRSGTGIAVHGFGDAATVFPGRL